MTIIVSGKSDKSHLRQRVPDALETLSLDSRLKKWAIPRGIPVSLVLNENFSKDSSFCGMF